MLVLCLCKCKNICSDGIVRIKLGACKGILVYLLQVFLTAQGTLLTNHMVEGLS
jgi:hypothetical protein